MAQAIAFNGIFAVFPLLILTFTVLGFVYGGADAEAYVLSLISQLAPSVQPILTENLAHIIAFRGVSGAVALIGLLWASQNLVRTLAFALDRALGVPKGRPFWSDLLVAVIALPILGVVLLAATAVPLGFSFITSLGGFPRTPLGPQISGYAAGILLVFVVTMLFYNYLPNRRVGFGFGVPGAIVTTIAWEISQIAFAVYSTHVDLRHVYGALATVAILLLWFYYMGTIFLFGAQVSAQWFALRGEERASV